MNREIKFRAKRVNNSEWVCGYYVIDPIGRHRIYLKPFPEATVNTYFEVIPETVCQFTGLQDANGLDIYEGDIVKHDAWDYPFEIIFNNEKARFVCKMKTGITQYINNEKMVVVGNIHQNPELINEEV
jgi:uncharacterized phage protein (TIGR01671 family)